MITVLNAIHLLTFNTSTPFKIGTSTCISCLEMSKKRSQEGSKLPKATYASLTPEAELLTTFLCHEFHLNHE